jgi:hypothetical protein
MYKIQCKILTSLSNISASSIESFLLISSISSFIDTDRIVKSVDVITLDGSNSGAPEDEVLLYSMVNASGNDNASTLILE